MEVKLEVEDIYMKTNKEKQDKDVLSIEALGKKAPNKEVLDKEMLNKGALNKEDKVQKQRPLSMIDSFTGRYISIMLRCGNKLEGKLEYVSQYDITVTISHQPVVVMKHAIDYIELISKN